MPHTQFLQAALAGSAGAFFSSLKNGKNFWESLCFFIVGFLCAIYLTEPILLYYPSFNPNGVAFSMGFTGLQASEVIISYFSKRLNQKDESN